MSRTPQKKRKSLKENPRDIQTFNESVSSNIVFDTEVNCRGEETLSTDDSSGAHPQGREGVSEEADSDAPLFTVLRRMSKQRTVDDQSIILNDEIIAQLMQENTLLEDSLNSLESSPVASGAGRQEADIANDVLISQLISNDQAMQLSHFQTSYASNADKDAFRRSSAILYQEILNPSPLNPVGKKVETDVDKLQRLSRLCTATKANQKGIVDPSKWDPIQDFLLTNTDLMQRAARLKDRNGRTAMHQVCCHRPPIHVIEMFVSCTGVDILHVFDQRGRLPIHYACEYSASVEVVTALAQLNPESKVHQDVKGRTPLHYAILNTDIPQGVLEVVSSRGAASAADCWGMLPLHHAVRLWGNKKVEAIKTLIALYPLALSQIDLKGRIPIHTFLLDCEEDASLELFEFSLALDPAVAQGDMGVMLLNRLSECTVSKSPNHQAALDLLLRSNPMPSDMFLEKLKSLPRWLNRRDSSRRSFVAFKRRLSFRSTKKT